MAVTSSPVTKLPSPTIPQTPAASPPDAPFSREKSATLVDAVMSFQHALPPGMVAADHPPSRKDASGILHWLAGLFDAVRRHLTLGAAVGTYPADAVAQATQAVDRTQAAVSDCVRQHATDSDRHFGQRIASLFADLAALFRHWFTGAARGRTNATAVLAGNDIARWRKGIISRDDMLGLAMDAQRLRTALHCVHGIENMPDDQGNTLAHVVSGCGAFLDPEKARAACDVLTAAPGLDLTIRNAQGDTPLHFAVACANHPVNATVVLPAFITRAASAGFNFQSHDRYGMTVLQRAVRSGNAEAIDQLLYWQRNGTGVDVGLDALSGAGGTALCHALSLYRFDIAQKLVDAGANTTDCYIDNLPPRLWLSNALGPLDALRRTYATSGNDAAPAMAELVDQGNALLSNMSGATWPRADSDSRTRAGAQKRCQTAGRA